MKDSENYYNATINNKPSVLIRKFFINIYDKNLKGNIAIDLGCGAGNDTEFLLKKGFKVIAVDKENQVRDILENKNLDKENLKIIIDDFSKAELPNTDLVLANFSLFFINNNFEESIKKILKKINMDGFFVGNFLGREDEWSKTKTTIDKEELLKFFNEFKIEYFSEEKYYKETAAGKNKFWHVYSVIAQKKDISER